MKIDITIVADQEAFLVDAPTPQASPRRWIQAKRTIPTTILRSSVFLPTSMAGTIGDSASCSFPNTRGTFGWASRGRWTTILGPCPIPAPQFRCQNNKKSHPNRRNDPQDCLKTSQRQRPDFRDAADNGHFDSEASVSR